MNTELLQFAMHLTGHGEEDIEQMYYDWLNSPSTPSFAPEQQEVSKTNEQSAEEFANNQFIKPYDNLPDADKEAWIAFYDGYLAGCQYKAQQPYQQQTAPFAEAWKQHLQQQIDELRKWKAEAMEVMEDIPAIGKALGVPLGQSIHDKILPAIQEMKERQRLKDIEIDILEASLKTVTTSFYEVQSQLAELRQSPTNHQ